MVENYSSVPTMVNSLFRMVDNADSVQLCKALQPLPFVLASNDDSGHGRLSDPIMQTLSRLERKLDTVIGLLSRDNFEQDFPHQGRSTQLSATGFTMETIYPLAPGDFLEVVLFLEETPLSLSSGIARVENILQKKPQTGEGNTVFSLIFKSIREEEREAIIRYVFQEERKRIRKEKSKEFK